MACIAPIATDAIWMTSPGTELLPIWKAVLASWSTSTDAACKLAFWDMSRVSRLMDKKPVTSVAGLKLDFFGFGIHPAFTRRKLTSIDVN
jgi:hypothetical protein